MVEESCCQLVMNYLVDVEGIISVSTRSSTETSMADDQLIIGPTIGNVSISAYTGEAPHEGCPTKANVSIPWIKKYNCDLNEVHFIFAGQGNSSVSGKSKEDVIKLNNIATSYRILNVSAASGPTSIYDDSTQTDGYGLSYNKGPWSFETSEQEVLIIDTGIETFGPMYLTSFSYQANANQFPTVSYEFMFAITESRAV